MKTTRLAGARWIGVGTVAVVAGIGCRQIFGLSPGTLGKDLCTDPMTGDVIPCPLDGGGGGTTGKPCEMPSDCPPGDACETAACTGGTCGLVATNEGMACGTVTGQVCKNGLCTCKAPASTCAGSCVDTTSDAANCGGCGKTCPAGVSCVTSACDCPDGGTVCATACTDTSTDAMNCGGCGKTCTAPLSACSGSSCVCPGGQADCGGTCIDTTGDPKNCGACGHDCMGSACQGGLCQPVLLGTVSGTALAGITVDATNVYAVTNTAVMKVPIMGGAPAIVASIMSNESYSANILTDGTNLYWTSYPLTAHAYDLLVMSVPITGGTPTPVSSNPVDAFTIDSSNVYWFSGGTSVMTMPLGGGAQNAVTTGHGCYDVTVIGGYIYCFDSSGIVLRVPIGGGVATTLATGLTAGANAIAGFAVDAANLYWMDGTSVWSLPITGGAPASIATGETLIGVSPALDATFVYWTTTATVMKAPLAGGSPVTLVSGQASPIGLAADAKFLYWLNANGSVMRVAK